MRWSNQKGCPRVAIHSPGLWKQRTAIAQLLKMQPVRLYPWTSSFDAVAGWGFKPTSRKAIQTAKRSGRPYIAIEDGFYRSVRPGGDDRYAWIVDRGGIYYDFAHPSDLESHANSRILRGTGGLDRIREIRSYVRQHKLTKYNDARLLPLSHLGLPAGRDIVLVVDQTMQDASVTGAGADETTFTRMVQAAIQENPNRLVVVKQHPEAVARTKFGYLTDLQRRENVAIVNEAVNPWSFFDTAERVYVVSSQLGFDALLAGVPVTCFGIPFYAGWGLTDDRAKDPHSRRQPATIEQLAAAALLDYTIYLEPETFAAIDLETALQRLVTERVALLGE